VLLLRRREAGAGTERAVTEDHAPRVTDARVRDAADALRVARERPTRRPPWPRPRRTRPRRSQPAGPSAKRREPSTWFVSARSPLPERPTDRSYVEDGEKTSPSVSPTACSSRGEFSAVATVSIHRLLLTPAGREQRLRQVQLGYRLLSRRRSSLSRETAGVVLFRSVRSAGDSVPSLPHRTPGSLGRDEVGSLPAPSAAGLRWRDLTRGRASLRPSVSRLFVSCAEGARCLPRSGCRT
jgi:hypothetical protein